MKVFKKMGWFFKREWRSYTLGVIMLILVALLELVPPQVIGWVIDRITQETLTGNLLMWYILLLVAVAILTYIFRYFWRIMIFGASYRLGRILRSRLYRKYSEMSPAFYQKRRTGDLMAHATNDIQAVQSTAGAGILTIADSLITGGAVLITMAITISPELTLLAMIPLPFMVILTSYYGKLLNRGFKKAQAAFSMLNDKTQESISGIKVTKTFGYEQSDQADFRKMSDDVVEKNLKVSKVDALFDPTIMTIIGASYFISIFYGARMVLDDTISIGELVTFTTYLGMMVWPLLALGWFFNLVQRGSASYDRIQEIMDTRNQVGVDYKIEDQPEGDITFDLGAFNFPDDESDGLRDVRFTIEKGTTVGIVGRTGSGKSALIRLLLREFDTVNPEDIKYGEHPLRDYEISNLRRQFGYVPQDHFLFSTSIQNNIAFSNPEIEKEEIYHAARLSHVHEDIKGFTEGYETVVGERGVSVSGGQKQRISIARALIMDPEVLILDDSLSAVDAETEEQILTNLQNSRAGKTNIITAHRMSAVSHADLIIVMDNGTVIEHGNHRELMNQGGWYHETYNTQALRDALESSLDDLVLKEEK
ncbi:ABC transporter transmembrane domain-containing protein [Salinicoccus hispanicus]|uniref:ATP-binding cassette domain-containing protein n=1 Tax=Salinicoccus hispanicus TaxID=157225 RepID=A0A6N8TVK0_9STAP|nr:ABC transporter transmembrane domain-containing protein [Salinicoccus hispanicus]MXQ49948.1 ATP-binding cassette domain-containing protein [Salinicoccus hispanicus]